MSSETGFQLGKERTMRYALVPHEGDWRDARVFRDGLEFNHPLLARAAAPHPGPFPARWGLLDVAAPNVVLSALKPARDGGWRFAFTRRPARRAAGVDQAPPRSRAREANLLEDAGKAAV